MKKRTKAQVAKLLQKCAPLYDTVRNARPLQSYSVTSKDTVWWKCRNCKQAYQCTIHAKVVLGAKCKLCREEQLHGDEFPILRTIFLETKNSIALDAVRRGTHTRYWFRCDVCGDERRRVFKNVITSLRTTGSPGCENCYRQLGGVSNVMARRNQEKIEEVGSLAMTHPHIAAEWDYQSNVGTPDQYLSTSGVVVHWICKAMHRWKAPIGKRVAKNRGCRKCGQHISQYEKRVVCELEALGFATEWNTRLGGVECDVLLRSQHLVIEVDGYPWHETEVAYRRELRKERVLSRLGFTVIRYRCSKLKRRRARSVQYIHEKENSQALKSLFRLALLHGRLAQTEKAVLREYCMSSGGYIAEDAFRKMQASTATELFRQSFAEAYPEYVTSWSARNGDLMPTQVAKASKRKIWWQCTVDPSHQWESRPTDRVRYGCPMCSNARVTPDDNFYANHKEFCERYVCKDRNTEDLASRKTFQMLWVRCVNGHCFELSLTNLNDNRRPDCAKAFSCPKCHAVMPYDGSAHVRRQEYVAIIERYWDYHHNRVDPLFLRTKRYAEKYWWTCPAGHSFQKAMSEMLNLKIERFVCPKCGPANRHPKL